MAAEAAPRLKRTFFAGLILLLVLAAVSLPFLPRDNSIANMLPGESGIHRMLNFLHEARFASQVALSFERTPDVSESAFMDSIQQVVERLDSPVIERAIYRMDFQSAGADIAFFQQQIPALTDSTGLSKIAARLDPDSIKQTLRANYLNLLKPGGSIALPLIQRDPLGIEQDSLTRLQLLAASSGYTIEIKNGFFFSTDGLHALAVLETTAPVTDVSASRELLAAVESALSGLPDGISADTICGHRHAVSNEAILKRDVQRAVLAASIGFILLFALCFRDHRAQFIFAIPLASVLLSIHICRWLTGSLSLLVLGFGVVIVGIAVDYGIHVYVAMRSSDNPAAARRGVVRPIVLGALTTLGVFAAFFASGVPGYFQMAVFSITSIILSLLGALYLLPHLIKPRAGQTARKNPAIRPGRILFILWLVLIAALLVPLPRLSFDSNLQALDGAERSIWDDEEKFRSVWGDGAERLALVVVEAEDTETALSLNDDLYAAIQKQGATDEFSSLSSVWKSQEHRAENRSRWAAFWTKDRAADLQTRFEEQGGTLGFKTDAFEPFFQTLENPAPLAPEPENNRMFENLKTRFTQSLNGKRQLVSFFPDTDAWMGRVHDALGGTDALLISRREINRVLSSETVRTVQRVSSLAVVLVILFTALLMRRPGEVVLALLPAAASVLGVLKILELTGLPINIPTLISGIVVIGLAIDYGIFMVFGCKRGTLNEVCVAVTLSMLTSLLGAGVLLLTRHPALFSIGVTLVAGLTAGYATALCAIPFLFSKPWRPLHGGLLFFSKDWKKRDQKFQPLEKCREPRRRRFQGLEKTMRKVPTIGKGAGALLLLLLSGCAVLQPRVPLELQRAPQPALPAPKQFRAIQSVVFRFCGRSMTGIGMLSLDREARSFELSCMTPMGSKLFDLRYKNETPEVLFALPFFTEKEGFAEAVTLDIARIYFDPEPPNIRRAWQKGGKLYIESGLDDEKIEYRYTGAPPVLTEKRFLRGRALEAQIEYLQTFEQDGFRCIGGATLKSKLYGYRLTVRTKNLSIENNN